MTEITPLSSSALQNQIPTQVVPPVKVTKPRKRVRKIFNILISLFSILLILITITGVAAFFLVYVPGKALLGQIELAKKDASEFQASISSKDLVQIKSKMDQLGKRIQLVEASYKKLSTVGSLPYAKDYYNDGQEMLNIAKDSLAAGDIVIKAVEPYQDFLGLKGASSDAAKTTEDRIAFLTQTVEGLVPHMGTIEKQVSNIETSLNNINANRYPDEFRGIKIKSSLLKAKETVAEVHKFIKNGQPILSKTSWLLGKDKPRNYFLIFQNDAELRPTGGFWTAYGIIKVDKGKITPVISDDIYSLDAKLNSTAPAPRPIKAYHINVPYFNIRDMNISPDFPTSMQLFLNNYNKINRGKDKIDAVVAIDTKDLVDLVAVLGRVGVPGFGNFSAEPDKRCDGCPQIIYELEMLADRPKNYLDTNRKGFLAPLMNSLLSNAMGSEKSKIGPLGQAMLNDVYTKHILFYFPNDAEMQNAAVLANIGGQITQTDKNTDYFHLNDSNMASAKTNLFLKTKVKHEIIVNNDKVEHKVSVTYTNPSKASNCNLEKGDLCLNASKYRDWFRFYVPVGSTLTKMTGSEVDPVKYEELDKQVFEGFYGNKYPLYAQSSLKTSVQYVSSVAPSSNYTLLLQKQPGTKAYDYELWVNGQKQESFSWDSDKTIKLAL